MTFTNRVSNLIRYTFARAPKTLVRRMGDFIFQIGVVFHELGFDEAEYRQENGPGVMKAMTAILAVSQLRKEHACQACKGECVVVDDRQAYAPCPTCLGVGVDALYLLQNRIVYADTRRFVH